MDFGFLIGNAVQRNIRLEGRVAHAACGAPTFHLGGPTLDTPSLAVGDTYIAAPKLAVGSYTTPGTNALSVTGTTTITGATTITAPLFTAASTTGGAGMTIPQGTDPSSPADGGFWGADNVLYYRTGGVTYQLTMVPL